MFRFHIRTWGCQMNYCDSRMVADLLVKMGLKSTDDIGEADLIVLNTCSVRQSAEDRVVGQGKKVVELKSVNPKLKVVMTGCMVSRVCRGKCDEPYDYRYRRSIKPKLPWVDYWIDIGDLKSLEDVISQEFGYIERQIPVPGLYPVIWYLPISEGCDNFCSYCIVPFTRGKERHRSFYDINKEFESLLHGGSKLIFLLGQNVNSWRGEIDGRTVKFPELLRHLSSRKGDFWLSFLTSHPKDYSSELISVIAGSRNICRYVNLPFQSGSDRILRRMKRGYSRRSYFDLIRKTRLRIPEVRISTDVIVGFPGETEADFLKTKSLLEDGDFSMAYVSEYSSRKGTASSLMKDDVSHEVKSDRKDKLEKYIRKKLLEDNNGLVGREIEVLSIDRRSAKTFSLVDFRLKGDDEFKPGYFVKVRVEDVSAGGLEGEIVEYISGPS